MSMTIPMFGAIAACLVAFAGGWLCGASWALQKATRDMQDIRQFAEKKGKVK